MLRFRQGISFLFALILFVLLWIGVQFIDLNGGKFTDIQTFAAIIADLVRIQVTYLAFQAAVALFFIVQHTHFPFHVNEYIAS